MQVSVQSPIKSNFTLVEPPPLNLQSRIELLGKNTFFQFVKSPIRSIISFSAVPFVVSGAPYFLLILPISWIAYNVIKEAVAIENQETKANYKATFDLLNKIQQDLADKKFEKLISESKNTVELKTNLSKMIDHIKLYDQSFLYLSSAPFKAYLDFLGNHLDEWLPKTKEKIICQIYYMKTRVDEKIESFNYKVPRLGITSHKCISFV